MASSITNVVFDMGNVLMGWTPFAFAFNYAETEGEAREVADAIFDSAEWPLVDAGAISEPTMLAIAKGRLPKRLHGILEQTYANYHDLQPVMWATNRLAFALADAGCRLYILSNAGERFRGIALRIPIFGALDGVLVSAFEHVMKPDVAIYRLFCERFGLAPEECVFVDDSPKNCAGAERAGMKAVCFTGDVERLRRDLAALGVPGAADYEAPKDADEPFEIPESAKAGVPKVMAKLLSEAGRREPNDPRPVPGHEPLLAVEGPDLGWPSSEGR